jgi:hypothetical protein
VADPWTNRPGGVGFIELRRAGLDDEARDPGCSATATFDAVGETPPLINVRQS